MENMKLSLKKECPRFLGHGSFGVVYKAKNIENNGFVVIKEIKIKNERSMEMIIQEISVQSELKHRNIVQIIDYFAYKNKVAIVMEFCNQGTLEDYLNNNDMDQEKIIWIFGHICQGLNYIHSQNIIHRDLKPANILIHNDILKIADFGLAKNFIESDRRTECGTRHYMAPEILNNASKVQKESCDIFSLGIIFVEILLKKGKDFMLYFPDYPKNLLKKDEKSFFNLIERIIDVKCQKYFGLIKLMLAINPESRPSVCDVEFSITNPYSNLNSCLSFWDILMGRKDIERDENEKIKIYEIRKENRRKEIERENNERIKKYENRRKDIERKKKRKRINQRKRK